MEEFKFSFGLITIFITVGINPSISLSQTNPNIEMVYMKEGDFYMGSREKGDYDSRPLHSVWLDSYYIGKYEVTQKQWVKVMGNNPSHFKNCDECPVENVSWNDVQEFIQKLNKITGKNYRLPTEAEWEYAAKNAGSTENLLYNLSNYMAANGWYKDNSSDKTHPVGQFGNEYSKVFDMNGNVLEWCSDYYDDRFYYIDLGERTTERSFSSFSRHNPKGPDTGNFKSFRGGHYGSRAESCRNVSRAGTSPDTRSNGLGFRLALNAK